MNAVVVSTLGEPEVLEYKTVDRPQPKSNEVLIRVAATSVNFADIKARKGGGNAGKKPPFIPGIDAAGTIEQVGSAVTSFHVGQRVMAFPMSGSYAEFVSADERLTFAIPESMDFETAAACPIVSFTAFNVFWKIARLEPGETVLVHSAAGGVGSVAVQLAKELGAGRVIGTVGNDSKVDFIRHLGVDDAINYQRENFVYKVLEITEGKGADVILNPQGGALIAEDLRCLAKFGRIVEYGNRSEEASVPSLNKLSPNCQSLMGYSFGTTRKLRPETVKETADGVLPYLARGKVKVSIDRRYPLQEAPSAHEWIESRQSQGKVLLIP